MTERSPERGSVLREPLVILALGLWLLNDHWLKATYHNAWTGKLSDVASLVVFPLLPVAIHEAVWGRVSRAAACGWVLATCLVMVSINLWEPAADAYRIGLGAVQWPFVAVARALAGGSVPALHRVKLWMDPTDLWTLPAGLVPVHLCWRRAASPASPRNLRSP